MIGSCSFLNLQSKATVASAPERTSVIERCASTMTAPAIAPIAAAVTPSTNAISAGCLPYFLKYGAGMIVKR